MGASYQWTSDVTERCHITHAKMSYCLSNHHHFHKQCCYFLDQQEKQQFFRLSTSLKTVQFPLIDKITHEEGLVQLHYSDQWQRSDTLVDEHFPAFLGSSKSFFTNLHAGISADNNNALLIAPHPHYPSLSINNACGTLAIRDLHPALGNFISGHSYTNWKGHIWLCLTVSFISCSFMHETSFIFNPIWYKIPKCLHHLRLFKPYPWVLPYCLAM